MHPHLPRARDGEAAFHTPQGPGVDRPGRVHHPGLHGIGGHDRPRRSRLGRLTWPDPLRTSHASTDDCFIMVLPIVPQSAVAINAMRMLPYLMVGDGLLPVQGRRSIRNEAGGCMACDLRPYFRTGRSPYPECRTVKRWWSEVVSRNDPFHPITLVEPIARRKTWP